MNLKKEYTLFAVLILSILIGCENEDLISEDNAISASELKINDEDTVRMGYFHGGRVNMIYRTHIFKYFDKEEINVKLYTRNIHDTELFEIPKSHEEVKIISRGQFFGKMRGTEIVDFMLKGELDGGTIGESSFIQMIHEGAPIVAVALLGYDGIPGKGIVMRKGVKINSLEDYKGLTLASRRAGPGDTIYFREFLEDIGLKPDDLNFIKPYGDDSEDWTSQKKDDHVNVLHQVDEGDLRMWLIEGKIDGGLYHLTSVRKVVLEDKNYLYRPMNWMDSAISHAVLVFNKDYVENHPDKVQKVVDAYVKRIKYEKDIPKDKRDRSWDKGMFMESIFQGLKVPRYDFPPRIRVDLLDEVQDLLIKYDYIDKKMNISNFVDDSFAVRATESIIQAKSASS